MLTNHRSTARLAAALLGIALVVAGWGCRRASGPCPATTLTITPNPLTIVVNTTRQLTATGRDYKGNVVSTSADWTVVAGGGTINASSGTFTAGAVTNTFPNTIRAVSGGLTATATVVVVAAPSPAVLGPAGSFSILAGSTVTNTGATTTIVGDVGVSPGTAITGIPAGQPTGGSLHAGDAAAASAQTALTSSYNDLAGRACGTNLTSLDLGGMTLAPGVYCFNSSAALTGTLTLDAQGNANAVFIIQIGSTLTTASNAAVVLSGGALARNVYWQVGSSATLGTGTDFVGNIVALQSITLNTGATLAGRALARNAAVTLDANAVALP